MFLLRSHIGKKVYYDQTVLLELSVQERFLFAMSQNVILGYNELMKENVYCRIRNVRPARDVAAAE